MWNGFLARLQGEQHSCVDRFYVLRALDRFSMYTRAHVRLSIHAAGLVLQESLQSIAMLLSSCFRVVESVCVCERFMVVLAI